MMNINKIIIYALKDLYENLKDNLCHIINNN